MWPPRVMAFDFTKSCRSDAPPGRQAGVSTRLLWAPRTGSCGRSRAQRSKRASRVTAS